MDSNEVRREWAERSGEYSPEYYAYYGPDERSEAVRDLLDRFVDRDARVLELGCSSGRHLAHLADGGFEDLAGIELNDDAFAVLAETSPALAASGTFYCAAIEDVVEGFPDDHFDVVYSVETLQHLHPDVEWVFDELVRITDDLLITVENESGVDGGADDSSIGGETAAADVNYVREDVPLYYRDWNAVFTERGMVEVAAESGDRDAIRAFRPAEE